MATPHMQASFRPATGISMASRPRVEQMLRGLCSRSLRAELTRSCSALRRQPVLYLLQLCSNTPTALSTEKPPEEAHSVTVLFTATKPALDRLPAFNQHREKSAGQ